MARKLGVDIAQVSASGPDGTVTMGDVKQAAADGSAKLGSASRQRAVDTPMPPSNQQANTQANTQPQRSTLSQSGKPMRTQPPGTRASGQPEQLKGVRRNMARVMADAHAQVVPTTLVDDADLHAWIGKQDITARLVRAIVSALSLIHI